MTLARRWTQKHTWVTVVIALAAILLVVVLNRSGKERLLQDAFVNLMVSEQLHAKVELVLRLPPRPGEKERPFTDVLIEIEGDIKRSEAGVPELSGTLYTEAKGRGTIFFADGDLRLLEEAVLFRLDNLPIVLSKSENLIDRWTRVEVPVLRTQNPVEVEQVLGALFARMEYVGKEETAFGQLKRFDGQLPPEDKKVLVAVLRQEESGNRGLGVLARLLNTNEVESFSVLVDSGLSEVRQVRAHFLRPMGEAEAFDFGELTLTFSDYGEDIEIDRPETELVVQPRVFAKLFGSGEVALAQ